ALNIQASLSDVIISQIITEKLDSNICKAWELKLNDLPFPPLKDFITFLEGRRRALENLNPGNVNSNVDSRSADGQKKRVLLLQNQSKEVTVVLKDSVRLKFYLPRPQLRSQTHG
ncbi:hypothetical protein Cfor_10040, partial [Coptotermes formosanus]